MYRFAEKNIDSLIHSGAINIIKINDFQPILDRISENFNIVTRGNYDEIWIQLMKKDPDFFIQDQMGWLQSINCIDTYPCYLIINDSNDRVVYKIFRAEDLEHLLNETIGFVYYLCSEDIDRIIFFNSYDTLAVFKA